MILTFICNVYRRVVEWAHAPRYDYMDGAWIAEHKRTR